MFRKNRNRINLGTEVERQYEEMDRQVRRKKRRTFFARLVAYPLLFVVGNGSFFLLVWIVGLIQGLKYQQSGILSRITFGVLTVAYIAYMYFFAKGLLALANKVGLRWIFSDD